MKNSLNKTILNYTLISAGAFLFDKIYSIFGHGVTSITMAGMYLYLLGLGLPLFILLKAFVPEVLQGKRYRLFFNTYNSGVAILLNGMLLTGILEIAGGSSTITPWFTYTGVGVIAAGLIILGFVIAEVKCGGKPLTE